MPAMIAFIAAVVLIYLGMQYYVAFWLIRNLPSSGLNPNVVRGALLFVALCFPLSMYCLRVFRGAWTAWFAYLSYIWLGIVFIWLACALLGDAAVFLAGLRGAAERARPWAMAVVLAATAAASLWAAYGAARMPRVKNLELELPNLSRELDGFTVVQLSDLHLGVNAAPEKFARIVAAVAALKPDLVALTGDIFDAGLRGEGEVARIGSGLKAPQGVFAVLGNHEFYHGEEDSSRAFRSMGVRLLRNEVVTLPCGLQVAGIDDIRTARLSPGDVAAVLAKLDGRKPSLFLSHQPLDFEAASRAGAGLMLSGHTHQGQIFPFGLIVRLFYRRLHGLYREGSSWLYVSSGTGQWGPPMRLFTRAEIVRVRLRSPRSSSSARP